MIKHIKKDLGIKFDGTWSSCNDFDQFKQYIASVEEAVNEKYKVSLFEYELNAWDS